ncbi:methyltransferase family protein [Gordonia polyisoprenivorans VH2]|uniref:Methyltransferase family protein n=1 Tax=Gordonia polyisoprenivorans (strain DSM 44266 / VH2) TaxID=1112204 RepID=H6N293_GORPV|nr:class I SAM-dependent methyltransferase [Gordonia polyisoprenivorans]AFA72206.1 methyltransferase family protein [Gordonia polyisoprenivorans VH2]OZC29161.1 class I SAM-dependent methyltransferase [Gordonia polyisoprenivorans]QUD81679.1 class I SAM-dependent methyltransferase [Gordonia polyisoprenivorans]UZF57558.1 class I SAM-dependent methyltransferase [Gordonia polyisoprenivorans]HCS59177.1 class I SAM-dependent methyltransferase [Gordonia polyisoprenivorans]
MTCRLCGSTKLRSILDLGATPPCERFLTLAGLDEMEPTYPLHLRLCEECLLLQIPALITPEDTFTEYAYFSSYSDSWVAHARSFVDTASERVGLDDDSFVVEVASNDGYLLRHVVDDGIACLGIEPSVNVGEAARAKGVPTETAFLDEELAERIRSERRPADLVVANNVYAHIPDLLGFTRSLRTLVADDGWVSIEVHHALNLVSLGQFDTIYHEHFQYYTVLSASRALATAGLTVVDVEMLSTHGGSIRLWARPETVGAVPGNSVAQALEIERAAGLDDVSGYLGLRAKAESVRQELLRFLLDQQALGKRVVGYGAPGKGNTLLNYCGIRPDLLEYTVDRNPYKHGRFTPGTRIPIHAPERIDADRPDVIVVLPWNLEDEITEQLRYVREWGGELVYPLPQLHIVSADTVSTGGQSR